MPYRGISRAVLFIVVTGCTLLGFDSAPAMVQGNGAVGAYDQALQLLQNGKPEEALTTIDAAIGTGVRDPSLYNLKGLAESELGRDRDAEQSFRTVITLSPTSAMGYNNLGVLLSKLGRNKEAAAAFGSAEAREPRNFTALLGRGSSLAALHRYGEAAIYLQRAWNVRPSDFQAGYEWALVLREGKQPAAAKEVLSKVPAPSEPELAAKYYSLAGVIAEDLKGFDAASKFYRQAYSASPGSYDIYVSLLRTTFSSTSAGPQTLPPPPNNLSAAQNLALGLLLASHGLYENAIPQLEESLQKDSGNQVAVVNLALAFKNTRRLTAAIALLQLESQRQPSALIYNLLAGMEEEAGQYVQAVQHFQRAVELDPNNEPYYFDLGMEYLAHFTFGPAAEVYRVGTQKFPRSSRQYLGLAYSHYAVREYMAAADAFTTALEIDPTSPAVFQAWKTVLSFLAPKDWENLLPRLSSLAASHPKNAAVTFCYGAALFHAEIAKDQNSKLQEAQTLLERAVRLQPNFPEAHLELGGLYRAQKQDPKAVAEYLEVIRQDPNSDIGHYRLGQIYRDMNKLDLARAELARYQELSRLHQQELKRNRSTIQQFVVSQGERKQ